ncbi:MAG: hypothetical protein LBG15_02350 [Dysgonamonadaceae bacterium]|jgi:hypothetical protein|nr:hypothetical protein [Dysgonamonadaceae bacterium]
MENKKKRRTIWCSREEMDKIRLMLAGKRYVEGKSDKKMALKITCSQTEYKAAMAYLHDLREK